jgi:hypothetical protein
MKKILNHRYRVDMAIAVIFLILFGHSIRADFWVSGDINDANQTYTFRDFSGAETFNGLGSVWNAIDVADGATPTFLTLVDSSGAATTVDFNFTSQVSTWRGNDPGAVDNRAMVRDYITARFTFTITGLYPGSTVDFYSFGTAQFTGSYNLTMGGAQKAVTIIQGMNGSEPKPGGSQSWLGLTPDSSGRISGTVSASGFSGFHIVQHTGDPAPGGRQIDAGSSRATWLPNAQLNLKGSTSGASGSVSVNWTKSQGPGTVTWGSPNALQTTASFSAAGTYVLAL